MDQSQESTDSVENTCGLVLDNYRKGHTLLRRTPDQKIQGGHAS
jgi:hypothetical protein